jgi:hypothetical protein
VTHLRSIADASRAALDLRAARAAAAVRGAEGRARLIHAELAVLHGDLSAEARIEAARQEIREAEMDGDRVFRAEIETRACQARRALAQDPGALARSAERRDPRSLLRLLAAFPDDDWANRIATTASQWQHISPASGFAWGPDWLRLVDDVRAFAAERIA